MTNITITEENNSIIINEESGSLRVEEENNYHIIKVGTQGPQGVAGEVGSIDVVQITNLGTTVNSSSGWSRFSSWNTTPLRNSNSTIFSGFNSQGVVVSQSGYYLVSLTLYMDEKIIKTNLGAKFCVGPFFQSYTESLSTSCSTFLDDANSSQSSITMSELIYVPTNGYTISILTKALGSTAPIAVPSAKSQLTVVYLKGL